MATTDRFWRDRRVFVTGCTGLVGAWLTRALLDRGAHVVGLVRDRVSGSELHRAGLDGRIDVVRGCVESYELLERVLAEYEVQTVFHLAAQTIVGVANRSPLSTFETNVKGTWCLLEAARRCGTNPHVVVASSDKAYGEQPVLPYTENAPLDGRHPYDASKSCTDILALTYAHSYKLPVCTTRCGNFYGGGDLNWNRIVPGTIRSVLRGERPVIRSDGTYIRDYFYVKDGAEAYLHLAECMARKPEVLGHAFNFSTEIQVTVLELVERITRLMGSPLEPVVKGEASNEIRHQYLSAEKARRMLGWLPRYSLDESLRETIDWYRGFLGADSEPAPPKVALWPRDGGSKSARPAAERVLVTGGSGFIGSALAKTLAEAGHEVHLISREPERATRLAELKDRCEVHRADLLDAVAVREAVRASRPDVVYHLAAAGVVAGGDGGPADVLRTAAVGTANLLDALDGRPLRALVHAGSGVEYGPWSEAVPEDAPLRPQTDYAVAKATASRLCLAQAARGWPVVVVRIFAAYGPGEAPQRLIPYVMGCCWRGEVAQVSAGTQLRDWVYLDDVVGLLTAAARSPAAFGQVLHAATGREHTVREAVEAVVEASGCPTPVVFGSQPLRPGEPERYLAAIERTRALTGWGPRFDLRAGIRQTWEWFRGRNARPGAEGGKAAA
jgi:CDP-glucose 4,6-dehydratase